MKRQFGIGFGLPYEKKFYIILYTGIVFRQITFYKHKGFKCYTYHYALNDKNYTDNYACKCKFFIGITINK